MALIQLNTNPSDRELRQFSGIWLPLFLMLLGSIVWNRVGAGWGIALFTVAALVAAVGQWWPRAVRPLFVGWMCAAYPLGWLISHLLLAGLFYLVVTPVGFIARRRSETDFAPFSRLRQDRSHWHDLPSDDKIERYFRQF